jgi:hypothetical protein
MPRRPTPHRLTAAAAALWIAGLAGCAAYRAADRDLPPPSMSVAALAPDAWPARSLELRDAALSSTPREIFRVELDGTKPREDIAPDLLALASSPDVRIAFNEPFGVGIIRRIEPGPRGSSWTRSTRFVSFGSTDDGLRDQRVERWDRFLERSAGRRPGNDGSGVRAVGPEIRRLAWTGVRLSLREPRDADASARPARGLIVHMAGLGSERWEQPLIDDLVARGWAVLSVATPRVWWFEGDPIRINSPADIEPAAKTIARRLDDLVAEPAYATEAALDYLAKTRPDLKLSPLVMLGCSAGSLAAPATVARLPDRFDAAVLVGSGANLLEISQTSDLTDGGIRLQFPSDGPRGGLRQRLFDAYLQHARLDPFHAAPVMTAGGMPTLLVNAELDSTVPQAAGSILARRLGPGIDRLTFKGGHRLLFWSLGRQSPRIADWIDRKTPPPA